MTSDRWRGAAEPRERTWWVDWATERQKKERGRRDDGGEERRGEERKVGRRSDYLKDVGMLFSVEAILGRFSHGPPFQCRFNLFNFRGKYSTVDRYSHFQIEIWYRQSVLKYAAFKHTSGSQSFWHFRCLRAVACTDFLKGMGKNTACSRNWRGLFSGRFGSQEGSLSCFNQPRGQFSVFCQPRGHFSVHFSTTGPRGQPPPHSRAHHYLRIMSVFH